MRKAILLVMVLTLMLSTACTSDADIPVSEAPTEEVTVLPTEVATTPPTEAPTEVPTEVVKPWIEEEVIVLAQMLYGEGRGVKSVTEQAACVCGVS